MSSTTTRSNKRGINWSKELENILLKAMSRKRPVWVHAHFSMASILKIFNKESKLKATANDIWSKLKVMYRIDDINRSQMMELPASFRERKDFALDDYKQFEKLIPASTPNEEDKNKTDAAVAKNSCTISANTTKKAVVRRPRKPKVHSLDPSNLIKVTPKLISKKPRKSRKPDLNQELALISISTPALKKLRKSQKNDVKKKPVSISKSPIIDENHDPVSTQNLTSKKPRNSQKVNMYSTCGLFAVPTLPPKKARKSQKIDVNLESVPISAIPVIPAIRVVTPKKRGRPFKNPIDTRSELPIPQAKKRRYKVTITK